MMYRPNGQGNMFEQKIHKALSKKAYNYNTFQQNLYVKQPRHQSDSMCELPPKKPNIEEKKAKKPNNFLTPTTSKKSQICEIWRQKSQSGNPAQMRQRSTTTGDYTSHTVCTFVQDDVLRTTRRCSNFDFGFI